MIVGDLIAILSMMPKERVVVIRSSRHDGLDAVDNVVGIDVVDILPPYKDTEGYPSSYEERSELTMASAYTEVVLIES